MFFGTQCSRPIFRFSFDFKIFLSDVDSHNDDAILETYPLNR